MCCFGVLLEFYASLENMNYRVSVEMVLWNLVRIDNIYDVKMVGYTTSLTFSISICL